MQLIMDAEPTADIKDKMSNLDETLDTNLKEPIESIKNEIANGNKENIKESQSNIIESTADIVNGENLKCAGDLSETPNLTETMVATNEVEEVKVDLDIKTEGICETNNGDSVQDTNGNEGPCDEKNNAELEKVFDDVSVSNVENDPKKDMSLENNVQNDSSKVEDKQENETVKILENVKEDIVEEVEDTSLSNKEDNKIHAERTKPDTEKEILVKEVKNNSEAEGDSATENFEILDKEIKDIEVLDVEAKYIEVDNVESKDNAVLDVETKDISSPIPDLKDAPFTANETKKEISSPKVPENLEIIGTAEEKGDAVTTDAEIFDTEMEKTTKNDKITKVLEVLETEIKEIDNLEEKSAPTVVSPESKGKDGNVISHDVSENITNSFIKGNDETKPSASPKISPQTSDEVNLENNSADNLMDCSIVDENESIQVAATDKEEILDIDEFIKGTEEIVQKPEEEQKVQEPDQVSKAVEPRKASFCKLSNTLDILSDDDEEPPQPESKNIVTTAANTTSTDKQCISIEDDDDIMLIDEDTESKSEPIQVTVTDENKEVTTKESTIDLETSTENVESKTVSETVPDVQKDSLVSSPEKETDCITESATTEIKPEEKQEKVDVPKKPLVAENFLKSYKKNLADMSRDELEEYCILKIVEGIVDRSNLSDIKSKLKVLTQSIDEYKKKAVMLSKQNRDLQLVLKSVQEEQKKKSDSAIIPLKITRSVGMQVLMTEKPIMKKKNMINSQPTNSNSPNSKPVNTRNINMNQTPRPQKSAANNQIPVPRLVPAATNPAVKTPSVISQMNTTNNAGKTNQSAMNGVKVIPPPTKAAEKRTHSRTNSVTVDLTDDEPPAKVTPRSSPAPPVRLVSPQNLLNRPQPQFTQALNSPRKVYIPISGPQGQNIRPGQTIMLKSVPPPSQRLRGPGPHATRMPQNQVRLTRVQNNRHPAPLPECMKQYQPPNWKALPPAPDLKLSKVENGIVISWKIEGYQEDSYEEIASYQLYAYQETNSPPNTALWKKIGDVKALPLPMACTLTQFMAGFKYYFAVRAVDVRSRLGPFSLPGSILLLNKM